jgi:hypothetical protein
MAETSSFTGLINIDSKDNDEKMVAVVGALTDEYLAIIPKPMNVTTGDNIFAAFPMRAAAVSVNFESLAIGNSHTEGNVDDLHMSKTFRHFQLLHSQSLHVLTNQLGETEHLHALDRAKDV